MEKFENRYDEFGNKRTLKNYCTGVDLPENEETTTETKDELRAEFDSLFSVEKLVNQEYISYTEFLNKLFNWCKDKINASSKG